VRDCVGSKRGGNSGNGNSLTLAREEEKAIRETGRESRPGFSGPKRKRPQEVVHGVPRPLPQRGERNPATRSEKRTGRNRTARTYFGESTEPKRVKSMWTRMGREVGARFGPTQNNAAAVGEDTKAHQGQILPSPQTGSFEGHNFLVRAQRGMGKTTLWHREEKRCEFETRVL